MTYEMKSFAALFLLLVAIQYLGLWAYLKIAERTQVPSILNRTLMWLAWLGLAALIAGNGVFGIKFARESDLDLNCAVGILPLIVGFTLSFATKRAQWKIF